MYYFVVPLVIQLPQARCRRRRALAEHAEGICFFDPVAAQMRGNAVLVCVAVLRAPHHAFPDSRVIATRRQPVAFRVPAIPIANHGHFGSIGRPNGEVCAAAVLA